MALGRYLAGIALFVLGGFIILIGIIATVVQNDSTICFIIGFIGLLLIIIGGFYARTAHRLVPQKIDVMSDKKSDRYCPECGRAIPFDAKICPYCENKFE